MLARYDNQGIELIIDTQTGESFATVSGYARMGNKNKSTISRRLECVAPELIKTVEIPTSQELRTVALIPESLIVEWPPDDNPQMTKQLLRLGVRASLFL